AAGECFELALEDVCQDRGVAAAHVLDDIPRDRAARGHRLQAAGAAAATARSSGSNDHVADLASATLGTVVQLAADDDAATDPRADEDRQHRVVAAAGAEHMLA